MKITAAVVLSTLLTSGTLSATAQMVTYSDASLASLTYVGNTGDAQFVAGTPDVAQLYTADLSTAGDSPAVFANGDFGTLDSFLAGYVTSTGTTIDPYFILYLAPDSSFSQPIVATSSSSTLDGSSLVHVGNLTMGSIALSTLAAEPYGMTGQTWGEQDVAWVGLEIGDGGSGAGTANIASLTAGSVPEPSTLPLLGIGLTAAAAMRRRLFGINS